MLLCPQERCLLQTQLQQALQLIGTLEQEKREFTAKMDGYSETFATCQQSITHSHEVHAGCAPAPAPISLAFLRRGLCDLPACSGLQA